jgi:diguanylate cyclase (GGDEF)-like protein
MGIDHLSERFRSRHATAGTAPLSVRALRLAWLAGPATLVSAVAPVGMLFAWSLISEVTSTARVVVWMVFGIVVAATVFVSTRRLLTGTAVESVNEEGELWLAATHLAAGAIWGLLPWLIASGDVNLAEREIALVLPGVTVALAVAVLASSRLVFAAFYVGTLIPWASWLATHDVRGRAVMALGAIAFSALIVVLHRQIHRLVLQWLELAERNRELVDSLRDDHARTREANLQLQEANIQLSHQARHDPLTGLMNRRGVVAALEEALARGRRSGHTVGALYVDLDRFKVVNDSLGHGWGDEVLRIAALRMRDAVRREDTVGRLGGDEFVVITEGDPTSAHLLALAERVRASIAHPMLIDERPLVHTASVGAALAPTDASSATDLLRCADVALYAAKQAGRDRTALYSSTGTQVGTKQRIDAEQSLRSALDSNRIVAYFQPEFDARSGHIIGAEALARWIDDDGNAIVAGDFINLAYESGLIDRLSESVMSLACTAVASLADIELPPEFRIRVNLPPRYGNPSEPHHRLIEILSGCPPHRLAVEVTEQSIINDVDLAAQRLEELRELGVEVSLDDFGTGVSSLTLLQQLPLDGIKIDRSFVAGMSEYDRDLALVTSVVQLARSLGLHVVAEGVETTRQAKVLLQMGCYRHQGFLYAPALPLDELRQRLAAGR